MAKVIKLKDRQGSLVLPLTRSQLVQVSEITGLNLASGKTWSKASVQDALQALYTYASTNNSQYDADILQIQKALQGLLDATGAVATAVQTAQDNSYAKAVAEATEAQNNAYAYIASREAAIAAAYEAADTAIINAYEAADQAIITGYEAADTVLGTRIDNVITGYQAADTALGSRIDDVITGYEAADTALNNRIDALDASYTVETGKVFTQIDQVDGQITNVQTAYLTATDIKRESTMNNETHRGIAATTVEGALAELEQAIQVGGTGSVVTLNRYGADTSYTARYEIAQGGDSLGYIDIPKDMVATAGSLVYGSMSGDTFTPAAGGDPYIEMTIANGDPFYIPVKGLVEYNEFSESDEVGFTDSNHNVTAYIREVDTDKVKHNGKSVTSYISDIIIMK